MTSEERRLLRKAAADPKGKIAIRHRHRGEDDPDRDRLAALFSRGYLEWLGEIMGPHIGDTFSVWQITPAGRSRADVLGPLARHAGMGLPATLDALHGDAVVVERGAAAGQRAESARLAPALSLLSGQAASA